VSFLFLGGNDDHVAVEFSDGEVIGFPIEFVEWESSSATQSCAGIEIEPGVWSGCDQSAGDCPTCGL
jgi:hypothetical protein